MFIVKFEKYYKAMFQCVRFINCSSVLQLTRLMHMLSSCKAFTFRSNRGWRVLFLVKITVRAGMKMKATSTLGGDVHASFFFSSIHLHFCSTILHLQTSSTSQNCVVWRCKIKVTSFSLRVEF